MGNSNQLFETYNLSQNYPNPFNPNTEIHFALPYESSVKLNIYNVNGQLIKTLVDDNRNAGYYAVSWDGTDNHNKQIGSGIYLYKLTINDQTETKKMTMLK